MRLGLGLGIVKSAASIYKGILDKFPNAVAAYSTRKLKTSYPTTLPADYGGGAAAAYSLRKVKSDYEGSAVKVRRSSDGELQDIGFDNNGNLDTTALLAFVGGENLLLQSEDFTTSWSLDNVISTANVTTDPNGTENADLLDDGTASSTQHWIYQSSSFSNSTTYTLSFYAKYQSRQYMAVNIYNGSTSQYVYFDIQNGSIYGSTGDVTASITSVGDGWYRVVYTRTMAATGSPNFRIAMADDSRNITYTGSNKQTYIWGAQLEEGSTASTYNKTTTGIGGDGAVTTFYDQTGNGNHATNSTASEQPLIVSGGRLRELKSKAAINGNGTDDILSLSTGLNLSSGYSIFQVVQVPSANSYGMTINSSDTSNFSRTMIFDDLYRLAADGTNYDNYSTSGNKGAQYLWSSIVDGSGNLDTNRNGSAYGSTITSVTGTFEFDIIGTNIGANSFEYFQELIVFNSDQSTNRTGMETNINDHFSIYP